MPRQVGKYFHYGLMLCIIFQIYTPLEENRSTYVHTAWAMLGLIHAGQVSSLCTSSSFPICFGSAYILF
jgi:hypothetical protein